MKLLQSKLHKKKKIKSHCFFKPHSSCALPSYYSLWQPLPESLQSFRSVDSYVNLKKSGRASLSTSGTYYRGIPFFWCFCSLHVIPKLGMRMEFIVRFFCSAFFCSDLSIKIKVNDGFNFFKKMVWLSVQDIWEREEPIPTPSAGISQIWCENLHLPALFLWIHPKGAPLSRPND